MFRLVVIVGALWGTPASAQRTVPVDSVFARAERMAAAGATAAGRVLIDSVLTASEPGAAHYPAALALKARLASSVRDAEHAYLRIVVEYPLSPQVSVALRELADIDLAQGRRESAVAQLSRFVREYPSDREVGNVSLSLFRLLADQDQLAEACAMLLPVHAATPTSAVELRNRLEFATNRCVGVDTSARARSGAAAAAVAPPPARGRAATPPAAAATRFTVQTGAYDTKAEADRAATRLRGLGFEARVVGTRRPFRVHVGRFADRAGAETLSRRLTAQRIENFITTVVPDGR